MRPLATILLASTLAACGGPMEFDDSDDDRSMAINGTNTAAGAITTGYNFTARLMFDQGGTCTGALITPRHVLTAGHCKPTSGYPQGAWVYFGSGSTPRYRVNAAADRHHGYIHGATDMYDLAIVTLTSPVTGIEPVKLLPRRNTRHLATGSYVRHVSWGPSEAGGFGVAKSTLITRTTSVANDPPGVYTTGDANPGDSGSPVLQRRRGAGSAFHSVLVAVLSDGGIRSTWINDSAYSWIRGVVGGDLSDDYDSDGRANIDDDCSLRSGEGTDTDADGVGSTCDTCSWYHDAGQFDPSSCGRCPFPVSAAPRFDRVQLHGSRWGYWSQNRARLELVNARSTEGLWSPQEFRSLISVDSGGTLNVKTNAPWLTTLSEGHHTASVRLRDGCGNDSASRTINFGIDDTLPTLSVSAPTSVRMFQPVNVTAVVGDKLSGVAKVEVWANDQPCDGDLCTSYRLCSMPGPFLTGNLATRTSCSFTSSLLIPRIVVAVWDRAGNMRTVARTIRVTLGGGK